jgi:hypothetical protein
MGGSGFQEQLQFGEQLPLPPVLPGLPVLLEEQPQPAASAAGVSMESRVIR